WEGVVTEIGIRTTKVKFVTDVKVFNNSSLRDIVCSEEVVRQSVKIGISYDADFEEIERILKKELSKIGPEQIPGLRKGPTYTGISSFDESSIVLPIAMFVEGNLKFPAVRALNREIKLIFDRNNIEIPFNQLVVHEAEKPVL
ncbi:MAG: mechanosensitive ion channel family protein, partial [Oribacterium sp.]|nr:mechanosensitive ion channel family protein [Oribacterium sp.]